MNNKLKILILIIVLCITAVFLQCSINVAGGGTEDVNTKTVVGVIYTESNQPAPNTQVMLIRNRYNPVADSPLPDSLVDTTESDGNFSFHVSDSGQYNIQAVQLSQRTRLLITGITVQNDTTVVPDAKLNVPGSIKVLLPDTVDTVQGYLYIEGTTISRKLSGLSLQSGKGYVARIDSVPESVIEGIYYNTTQGTIPSQRFSDTVTVTPDDSITVEALIYWKVITKDNTPLPADIVRYIEFDNSGNPWFGTDGGGIAFADGANWMIFNTANSGLPDNVINVLAVGKQDNLWVGTDNGGIARYDGNNWIIFDTATVGLPYNSVQSIAFDSSDNRWFGMNAGHVARFDGTNWEFFDSTNTVIRGDVVSGITVDSKGIIWFSIFEGGLFRFDGTNWMSYTMSNSPLPDNNINSMTLDHNDMIWLASDLGSVTRFDGNASWQTYADSLFPGNRVYSVTVESNNSVWITNDAGQPVRMIGNDITIFTNKTYNGYYEGIAQSRIDKNGDKWCSRFPNQGGGVVVFGPTVK